MNLESSLQPSDKSSGLMTLWLLVRHRAEKPVKLTQISDRKANLHSVAKSVVICYGSNRKLNTPLIRPSPSLLWTALLNSSSILDLWTFLLTTSWLSWQHLWLSWPYSKSCRSFLLPVLWLWLPGLTLSYFLSGSNLHCQSHLPLCVKYSLFCSYVNDISMSRVYYRPCLKRPFLSSASSQFKHYP